MSEENVRKGNPKAIEDNVFGSNDDDFFSRLENDVNSAIQSDDKSESTVQKQATSTKSSNVEQTDASVSQESPELATLKKRYSDSSREAQKLKAQLQELKPFVPVLDAMKKDNGLIEHVRDYFDNGGNTPKNIKERLNLDEDFVFDPDDMINNPDSDSAKVFGTMVDNIVQKRASQILAEQEQIATNNQTKSYLQSQAVAFRKKHNMTAQQFQDFVNSANARFKQKGMTFDDMYTIMNQGNVNQNIANSTKQDMLNQMKNVRDIPKSQSSANSQPESTSHNDNVFDALKDVDGGLEDMFG